MMGFHCWLNLNPLLVSLAATAWFTLIDGAVPVNDACENAVSLEMSIGQVLMGSTVNGTTDGLNFCGENTVNSPGVWYTYQTLEEKVVQVSTCTPQTDFDTAATVFSGFCSNLKCIGGRDDDLECDAGEAQHSTISWHAAVNQRYYVLIHGSKTEHTGAFGLVTTETDPLGNDDPSAATNRCSGCSLLMVIGVTLLAATLNS